jgi:hypothetical protein
VPDELIPAAAGQQKQQGLEKPVHGDILRGTILLAGGGTNFLYTAVSSCPAPAIRIRSNSFFRCRSRDDGALGALSVFSRESAGC